MEKRLLLAFFLSFLLLSVWGIINPERNSPPQPTKLQSIQLFPVPENELPAPENLHNSATENLQVIENNKFKIEFTNFGGNLKRAILKEYESTLHIANIDNISGYEMSDFKLDLKTENSIKYSFNKNGLKIEKTYTILDNEYIVQSEVLLKNDSENLKTYEIERDLLYLNSNNFNSPQVDKHDHSLLEYVIATEKNVFRKNNAFKYTAKDIRKGNEGVRWVGFRDKYFAIIIKPSMPLSNFSTRVKESCLLINDKDYDGGHDMTAIYKTEGNCVDANKNQSGSKYLWESRLSLFTTQSVSGNERKVFKNIIYMGPQTLSLLEKYGEGFEEIMKFSDWAFLDFIAKVIYKLMHFIYKIIHNWGITIIIISFIIYGFMYPLSAKGLLSMQKMQALQPQIKKIQEQYKNNPEKINKEMLNLYKDNKVNPFGGCLPLLLQMPVFVGLYQVLWRSVSFKGAGFLWIKDLSLPDRLMILPFSLPIIGNEINILPLLMIAIMVFQQKISSKSMITTDPAQIAQQKMMQVIMPLFIGLIFYKFASGLSLYFTFFYFLSTITQWKMSKAIKVA